MWTLTEQQDVDRPIVYGYLWLHRSTPERQAALTVALAQYCDQHELRLCGIFTDRGSASMDAPAFAGLLDVLLLSGAYGVVLPSAHHLGGRHVATRRREELDAVGARLLFVRGPLRTDASTNVWNIHHRAEESSDLWPTSPGVVEHGLAASSCGDTSPKRCATTPSASGPV